jgi:hypothetical protein
MTQDQIERVGVEQSRRDVERGDALLVCAYDDERCARVSLEGAIPLSELERRAGSLLRDQTLIFYCA